MRAPAALWLVVLAGALRGGVVHAEDKADAKFNEGKKLLGQKHYAEACRAFEDSYQLDPAIGTELNIARCYEEWGRLATAFDAYHKALKAAEAAKDPRIPKIKERIDALDPQVPRLVVRLGSTDLAGVEVVIDDKPIDKALLGQDMLVDPGPHRIEVRRGTDKRTKPVPIEAGGSSEVKVEVPPRQVVAVVPTRAPASPGRSRRLLGLGVGGGGVVGMGVASALTLSARSKYSKAIAADCGGSKSGCDDTGLRITHDARHEANIATIVFAGGAALAAAGVVLYVTAPKGLRVEPAVAPGTAGVTLSGAF